MAPFFPIVFLIVAGVVLPLIPMDPTIKRAAIVIVILLAVLWILAMFSGSLGLGSASWGCR